MEASDLDQECRLAMQAITSMEWQEREYGTCRLPKTTNFTELISFYRNLNRIAAAHKDARSPLELHKKLLPEEVEFLKKQQVTPVELEIALMLFRQ